MTVTTPIWGILYHISSLIGLLHTANQCTKFEDPSFSRSRDRPILESVKT